MRICLLGQNHRTAPIQWRERLAFDEAKQTRLAELVRADQLHSEAAVVNTCNRVELYTVTSDPEVSRRRMVEYFEELHGLPMEDVRDTLYFRQDHQAVRHLFCVASGLDSLVLGEGQVLAQVKDAQSYSRSQKLTHDVLDRALSDAVRCGKRVRSDTKLGEGAVSVAYAAVSLARKIFGELQDQTVLLLGAGDTGRRVANHLQLFGVRDLRVSNRSRERGEALASELDATLIPWEHIREQLPAASIVISATSASEPVLLASDIAEALNKGQRRNLFCIDLAVPRDIEPAAGDIPGVFLYNVDDLHGIVLEGEDQRRSEAAKAERIVDEELHQFLSWYSVRGITPALRQVRERMEEIRKHELEHAKNTMDPESYAVLEKVTHRMLGKFLHAPTVGLKRLAEGPRREEALEDFEVFFDLKDDDPRS